MYVQGFRMQVLRTWAVPPPLGHSSKFDGRGLEGEWCVGGGGALTAVEKYL